MSDCSQNMASVVTSSAGVWCGAAWPLCTCLSWSPPNSSSMCPCLGCLWNNRSDGDVSLTDDTHTQFRLKLLGHFGKHYLHCLISKQHSPGADGGGSGDSRSFCCCQWTIPDETLWLRGVSQKVISPVIFYQQVVVVAQWKWNCSLLFKCI